MDVKGFFRKLGKGYQAARPVINRVDDLLPPGAALLMDVVSAAIDSAERRFPEPKSGPKKLEAATSDVAGKIKKAVGPQPLDPAALRAAVQHAIEFQLAISKAFPGVSVDD